MLSIFRFQSLITTHENNPLLTTERQCWSYFYFAEQEIEAQCLDEKL